MMVDVEINDDLCKKYKQLTEAKSVKQTSMWLGTHEVEDQFVHVVSDDRTRFEQVEFSFPPSLVQIFMEQVANLLDQRNEHPSDVDVFRFTFDEKTGEVSAYNNGPSIPVDKVVDKDDNPVWLPEMLCHCFLSGSNHDKSSGKQRISLGAHGIGLKAMTSMSTHMRVECVDTQRGLYYKQDIDECNTKVGKPLIEKIGRKTPQEIRKGGTRFTYMLDYAHYKKLPKDIFSTLNRIFRAKAYQVAAYSGITVYYNNEKIPIKNAKQLAEMHFGEKPAYFDLGHPEWDMAIAFGPPDTFGKGERLSIINGGIISSGVHFDYILDHIAADARKRVEKFVKDKTTWRKTLVTNNLSILLVGTLPDLVFDAQIKNHLKMKNYKEYMAKYTWPKTYMKKVWPIIEAQLGTQYIMNSKALKTKGRRTVTNLDKYIPAYKLKKPESDLLAFEGDSAKSSAKSAMSDPKVANFSRKFKGIFLLGGCPINALKNLSTKKFGGITHNEPSKKLLDNVVWNDFMIAMNLRYDVKYDTPEAFATLNYQRYTNLVDKDLHGMGKIAAIMISNIYYFWPELLYYPDFMGYMDSPVIRAFPANKKLKVKEFSSQDMFDKWRNETFPNGIVVGWKTKWYKGLATHSDRECTHMFNNYDKLRISYTDEQKVAAILFGAYFGKESGMRKQLLSQLPIPIPNVAERKSITIKEMLDYYTREEQRYNLMCKLNHYIDNQILSHRRILAGLMEYMRKEKNEPIKVYQIGAFIAHKMGYHHGDASLYGAITWLAQDFVGARNIPMCLPLSQFGTRFSANDAGAPRYIDTQANPVIDAIYPIPDRELYEIMIEDGKLTIPVHLVPVVCMPILETNNLPGTGWAISKWARDYYEHVENIHRMMEGLIPLKMKPWTPHWNGSVVDVDGIEWSVGTYEYDEKTNVVTITELPFQTQNDSFIYGNAKKRKKKKAEGDTRKDCCLMDRDLIIHSTIEDQSTKRNIKITFTLMPDAMDEINENYGSAHFSPLEEYLYLKKDMGAMLNFMDDNGNVREFATYESVMGPWFLERYNLYPVRINRQCILLRLRIQMLTQKLRYIKERDTMKLEGQKRAKQDETLAAHMYPRFNIARLNKPDVPNDQIEDVVLRQGASYKYLLLNHDDMSKESIAKLKNNVSELRTKLSELTSPGIVMKTWRAEIAEVTRHVENGLVNGWVDKDEYNY